MFYKKTLKGKKETERQFEFDIFAQEQNIKDDDVLLKTGQAKLSYNFISEDGSLKSGYGFKALTMPVDDQNLDVESDFSIKGTEVQHVWELKYYDIDLEADCNCLFYYNDANEVCFDALFRQRSISFSYPTKFSSLPFITHYRYDKQDAILLSSKDGKTLVITSLGVRKEVETPGIISCCSHYGKLFAITAEARGSLVYTDTDVINWDNSLTKNLDFTDERGDLNRIISFNDYIYLFRDFGITEISAYSNSQSFAVSHVYRASNYIQPNTIVEYGDNVYFIEGDKLKVFNGTSVKEIEIKCLQMLNGMDNRYINAECYDGKYFLACRADFKDGQIIGCENCENGFKNNLLIIYDIANKQVDLLRGVDIRQMLALTNNLKSKFIACFYNENKGMIGQLTKNGNVFGQKLSNMWKSGKLDFDMPGERKRIKSFLITSFSDCKVSFKSDLGEKVCFVKGDKDVQKIQVNVLGNMFEIAVESASGEDDYISNFVVTVSK